MLALLAAVNPGLRVVTAMLIVGAVFIGVIALGELYEWSHRRRKSSKARSRAGVRS